MGERIAVMQVTDSLDLGGAERVAVNLANRLPRDRYHPHLCVTRQDGPLAAEISSDVSRLVLDRRRRVDDWAAARRLASYIRQHDVRLLHAHKSTIFLCTLAMLLGGRTAMIWHDHFGRLDMETRSDWLYRLGTIAVDGVISVSEPLRTWALGALRVPPERIVYVPNFVERPQPPENPPTLPGEPGYRVVCACRIDPQKDLENFVRAFSRIHENEPRAHGLVMGAEVDAAYSTRVRELATSLALDDHVHWLGPRTDVTDVLQACDVGVLSSKSEGLPLALIEYGLCRLPSVATRVGQCADVLEGGAAGILVPPGDPRALADGVLRLLASPEERAQLADRAYDYADSHHTVEAALKRVTDLYDAVLG